MINTSLVSFKKPLFPFRFLFLIFLLSGCYSSPYSHSHLKKISPIDTVESSALPQKNRKFQKSLNLFDNHKPFEILSFTNTFNKNTTDTDTSICGHWILTKNNISEIIKNSTPISGTTWDLSFLVLTCTKSVIVFQNGQKFDMKINAASFFSIYNGDTTVLFGDYNDKDKKYFIVEPDSE